MGETVIHQILNKKKTQPIGWALLFKSLAPLRATALEPAARRARVVRTDLSQIIGLGLPVLTLLSHGEPHMRKYNTVKKQNPEHLRTRGFLF